MNTPADALSTFDYIYRLWPIFVTLLGAFAWLIKVEAKLLYLEKKVVDLSDRLTKNDEAIWNAVNGLQKDLQKDIREILQSLGKIEGQLEGQSKNH